MDSTKPEILSPVIPVPGLSPVSRVRAGSSVIGRFRRDIRGEWNGLRKAWLHGRMKPLAVCGVLLVLLMMWRIDTGGLERLGKFLHTCPQQQAARIIAFCVDVNTIGNFGYTLVIFLVLAGIQSVRRSPFVRRLAASVLVSALVVGVTGSVIKVCIGRVRPREMVREDLTVWSCVGPTLAAKYNSLPSGHSSFAAAGSCPVLMTVPWAGIPLTVGTLIIGGSRIGGFYHHPSDVLAGWWLGALVGCTSGLRLRRLVARGRRIAACRSR